MAAYSTPRSIREIDAAYIAGLIDGEGTITLSRKHRNEYRQLAVSISNTERVLLEYVLQTVGAGKITRKRVSHSHHTPSYTYAIYNRQALRLLEQLQPHLKGYKARRSALILRDYVALVNPATASTARNNYAIASCSKRPCYPSRPNRTRVRPTSRKYLKDTRSHRKSGRDHASHYALYFLHQRGRSSVSD